MAKKKRTKAVNKADKKIIRINMAKGKAQWSITLLRIVLGILFVYHGYFKLLVPGGLPGTAKYLAGLGIPLPGVSAVIVAYAEFVGGILLLIGLLTKYASFILMVDMVVALFVVHWPNGFSIANGGYEMVLVILAGLFVILNHPSKLALGNLLKNKIWR